MKSLEIYRGQEIQTLQKRVAKRFKTIEEMIGAYEQVKNVQGHDFTLPVPVRDYLSGVSILTL